MASQKGGSGLSFLVTPTVIEKQQVISHCETTTCTWWNERQLQATIALLMILGLPQGRLSCRSVVAVNVCIGLARRRARLARYEASKEVSSEV
jgi:hypothetical protein